MDAWNWLMDCYDEGSLTIDYLEDVMKDDRKAYDLYREFVDMGMIEAIFFMRMEVVPFLEYLKERQ